MMSNVFSFSYISLPSPLLATHLDLDLETLRSSSASGGLGSQLLGLDSRSLARVRTETKVLDSLSGVSGASDDDGVLALGGSHSQLVQGDGLATVLDDLGSRRTGESQGSNGGLREVQQSDVVGDSANNDHSLVSNTLLAQHTADSVERHRGSVDLGEVQSLQDDLVEGSIGTAWG